MPANPQNGLSNVIPLLRKKDPPERDEASALSRERRAADEIPPPEMFGEDFLDDLPPADDPPPLPPPMPVDVDWENNFVEKWIYLQGKSEVPRIYHRFCALSMIAATLQNKVWLELYKGSPLYPNLYTFLIGPSGIGKGRAISTAMSFLAQCGVTDDLGIKGGSITSAALIDFLSSKRGTLQSGTSRAYLVHSELSSSIKWGEHADAFVKRMTDLFTGDLESYEDATRTSGMKSAGKPCMNWLGASTRRWLITNIKADAMAGGFMARGLFPEVTTMPKERQFLPTYPDDYAAVFTSLQDRLVNQILPLTGAFTLERDATDYLEDWYMTRDRPRSEEALASWQRHRELSLKVAMCLSAGNDTSRVISLGHLYQAISMVEEVKAGERELWDFVIAGGRVIDLDFVSQKIALVGEIAHSDLSRLVTPRGIPARKLYELLSILESQNRINTKVIPADPAIRRRRAIYYSWRGDKPSLNHSRREDAWE